MTTRSLISREALELTLAADEVGAVALVNLAERDVLVLGAQQVDDAIDRQVERANLLLGQLDVNLAAQAAIDGDGGDAGHALETLRQIVLGDLAQLDAVELPSTAFDADAHDRRRARVELEHDRRVRFLRQPSAYAIEAVADVVGRLVQVHAPRQVERDAAGSFRRRRLETLEAGDRAERLLDRPRHELFHLERTDAGVATRTVMLGKDTSGIRSTGRRASEIPPISITTTDSMNIVTGR